MRYLVLLPSAEVRIRAVPTQSAIRIPLERPGDASGFAPFFELVYFQGVYSARYRADRRSGRRPGAYYLSPPDPWLLMLAAVMWEGILQGLAWDAVKVMCRAALASMRRQEVAPPLPIGTEPRETLTHHTARFRWTGFSTSARTQYELFLDLKRRHRELPPVQRDRISDSLRGRTSSPSSPRKRPRTSRRKA